MFFSMCQWGVEDVWKWGMPVGNSWRNTYDLQGNWKSILTNLDQQPSLSRYSGIGGWNDPDLLIVGNGLMTNDEYQSQFVIWAALKAPLLISINIVGVTPEALAILGNEEVIAINQDPLGKQADLMVDDKSSSHYRQIWGGPLSGDRYVFVCFNRGDNPTTFHLDPASLTPGRQFESAR